MRRKAIFVTFVAAGAGAVAVLAGASLAGMGGEQGVQDLQSNGGVRKGAAVAVTPAGPQSLLGKWQGQNSKTVTELKGVFAANGLNAWLVGGTGNEPSDDHYGLNDATVVRHTLDGGKNWQEDAGSQAAQTLAVGHTLQSGFAVGNDVWIIGEGDNEGCTAGTPTEALIIHSTNGGSTWSQQTSNTCSDLESMFMLDFHHGIIGGGDQDYLYTTDRGATWTPFSIGDGACTGDAIHAAIWFPPAANVPWNQRVGWGASCGIWRTTDGGQTWTEQLVDDEFGTEGWEDIDCPTLTSCIAVNDGGDVAWYNAGAGTWTTTFLEGFGNPEGDLMGAIMLNQDHAFALGEGAESGMMFVTVHGSTGWKQIVPPGGTGTFPAGGAFRASNGNAWAVTKGGDVIAWLN